MNQEVMSQRNMNKGVGLVLISAFSFGLMPVLAKFAYAENLNLSTLLTLRFCLASILLWIMWLLRRVPPSTRERLTFRAVLPVVLMGAVAYVGQSFSYFTAISLISASYAGLLLYAYPPAVTILSWLFLRERMTPRKSVALLCSLAGITLVLQLASSLLGGAGPGFAGLNGEGVAWGLSAAIIYALYIIAGTQFAGRFDPIFSSAVVITSAGAVYAIWGALSGSLRFDATPLGWLLGAIIAIVCTVVAIGAFLAGLPVVGPSRAAILSTAEPAVTVITSTIMLNEQITLEQIGGGVLIMLSILVLQSQPAHAKRETLTSKLP